MSGKKIPKKRNSDERSLPGAQEEWIYEPVSLVASACKAARFPLCLGTGVTQGEECPCHTVGVCGSFLVASGLALGCGQRGLVNHEAVSPWGSLTHPRTPPPTHTNREGARLSWSLATRANHPDL